MSEEKLMNVLVNRQEKLSVNYQNLLGVLNDVKKEIQQKERIVIDYKKVISALEIATKEVQAQEAIIVDYKNFVIVLNKATEEIEFLIKKLDEKYYTDIKELLHGTGSKETA
jgi:hypothetical protein